MASTGEQLVDDVLINLVKDQSFDTDYALALINAGLVDVAGEVKLPNLDTSDDVTTVPGSWSVDLPDDYQHGLYMALLGKREISVCNSKGDLVRNVGRIGDVGQVRGVAAVGDTLFYANSPAVAATITLHYYRIPLLLTYKGRPDCFSNHIAHAGEQCVKFYAAWKIWEIIEAGEEGPKANTNRFQGLYVQSLAELRSKIKEGVTNPAKRPVRSAW